MNLVEHFKAVRQANLLQYVLCVAMLVLALSADSVPENAYRNAEADLDA